MASRAKKPPADAPATPPETPTSPSEGNGNGKKKPEVSYKCYSDRSTKLEVAVFAFEKEGEGGEMYKQYSLVFSRSYKDANGTWHNNSPGHRVHDMPVLLFLLEKAYKYCLDARTEDTSVPF